MNSNNRENFNFSNRVHIKIALCIVVFRVPYLKGTYLLSLAPFKTVNIAFDNNTK